MLELDHEGIKSEYQVLYEWWNDGGTGPDEFNALTSIYHGPFYQGIYLNWGSGARDKTLLSLLEQNRITSYHYDLAPNESLSNAGIIISDLENHHEFFDGIYSNNMVEHLLDPVESFKKMNKTLKMGGLMAHRSDSWGIDQPHTHFHVYLNLIKAADIIALKSGFELVGSYERIIVFRKIKNYDFLLAQQAL